jgi:hypothetical protein
MRVITMILVMLVAIPNALMSQGGHADNSSSPPARPYVRMRDEIPSFQAIPAYDIRPITVTGRKRASGPSFLIDVSMTLRNDGPTVEAGRYLQFTVAPDQGAAVRIYPFFVRSDNLLTGAFAEDTELTFQIYWYLPRDEMSQDLINYRLCSAVLSEPGGRNLEITRNRENSCVDFEVNRTW